MIRNVLLLDPPGGEELQALARAFRHVLGEACTVYAVASRDELVRSLRSRVDYQLVVVDFARGDGEEPGSELLRVLRASHPDLPVVAVSQHADVATVQRAIAAGANDFLVLGEDLDARVETLLQKVKPLQDLIEHSQELEEMRRRWLEAERERYQIVGQSPQIRAVIERVERVASIPRPVLIVGERGTGKELVARAIHLAGGDSRRPLVSVNCAALPDTLLESELFGYERGAFTGADRRSKGKFELADGGTLFLDEIGHMSLPFQQKILRTVEYGVFNRVGGTSELKSSARIIAATNVDLQQKMRDGEFLRDLYDRLAFEVLEVPPLRRREGDIELLAQYFLSGFVREIPAFAGKRLSRAALDALRRYPFPGNVRELKNLIERAAYRDSTVEIGPADMGLEDEQLARAQEEFEGGCFHDRVESFKKRLILEALEQADGNQSRAARLLDISYHQFRYFYRKYSPARAQGR